MARVVNMPEKTPKLDDAVGWERAVYSLGAEAPRYNPDALVRAQGLPIYSKMRDDEQVKAVMQFRRDAVQGRGWTLVYDKGSKLPKDEQAERITIMTQLLQKSYEGTLEDGFNCIWTGRDFGFSLTEKVFTNVEIDGQTYVGLRLLLGRDQTTFQFFTDEYGLLDHCEQMVNGKRQVIDMSRFVHYVHNPEFDRYYGRSELREAYRPWYIKQRIDDYWALYMERFAGGFLVLTQDANSQLVENSPTHIKLEQMLRNLHGCAGILLPKGITAQMFFPPAVSAGFSEAVESKNLAIAKAVLVPNLLGLSHTGQTGAFAQSQTQLEAFTWTLNADGNRFRSCIKQQLIDDLGRQNWDDGEYPCLQYKPASVEFIKWVVEMWTKLTQAGNVITTEADEQRLRSILDFDPREEDDQPLQHPNDTAEQQRTQQTHDQTLQNQQREQDRADAQLKMEQQMANRQQQPATYVTTEDVVRVVNAALNSRDDGGRHGAPNAGGVRKDARPTVVPHGDLRGCTVEQFNSAAQRVFFSVIERQQDVYARELVQTVSESVAKVTKRLLGTNEQLAQLTDQDVSDVESVEPSSAEKSRINQTMRRGLMSAWDLGLTHARNEIDRAKGQRRSLFTDLRDRAAAYFETRAFRMAGDVSDRTRNLIQQELMNSIKYGRSPDQTREIIWQRLVDAGMTSRQAVRGAEDDEATIKALDELWVDTEEQAASYLNTLARTNMFEAMNEARFAEFTDPALGGFVQALTYSAILDDHTTEICQALNNDTFAADSDLWDMYRPPNHFNCRGILVPVTQVDGWDGQESPPPDIEPADGFGAGAK